MKNEKKKRTFQEERWYERVIKTWCVNVRLSLPPLSLSATHICTFISKLTPPLLHLSVV